MRFRAFLIVSSLLVAASAAFSQQVVVSLDAEEEEAKELLAKLNENGAKEGVSFTRAEENYQYRSDQRALEGDREAAEGSLEGSADEVVASEIA
jgi:hypothetical protein